MQANYRDNHYFIYLRNGEVGKINSDSPLEAKLIDENTRQETGKSLRLSLGGNRKGIEASLKYSPREKEMVYLKITKKGKKDLIDGKTIYAKYSHGMITIQKLSADVYDGKF